MNRSYRFYIMFCSFSLARVFVILRELVNLLTSVCSRDSYVVLRLKVLLEQCIPLPAVVGCRKEKSPLLRNFSLRAKTTLSAPRRYRSCPSELPTPILNQGIVIRLTLWV